MGCSVSLDICVRVYVCVWGAGEDEGLYCVHKLMHFEGQHSSPAVHKARAHCMGSEGAAYFNFANFFRRQDQ